MDICAVVAEYNPFHNGHRYHLEQTRAAGAAAVVAVMSGCFVQRAEPAILSKFARAKLAVQCGADLVLELPVQYATASSERFAAGAVAIADALGCVDTLSFGSECGDTQQLRRLAEIVTQPDRMQRTKELCEAGNSYPVARRIAVAESYGEEIAAVLDSPNNLLAVDYIKALDMQCSSIKPFTVRRTGAAHDSAGQSGGFASAGHIRQQILSGQDIASLVPPVVAQEMERRRKTGGLSGGLEAIERLVLFKLRTMTKDEMATLPGCADGLGHRLFAAAAEAATLNEVYERAKTRRYTMSRVRRAVLSALLDLDDSYYFAPPYARILAIGARGTDILARMKKTATIPFTHAIAELEAVGGTSQKTATAEIRATDLYNLTTGVVEPKGQDYTQKLYRMDYGQD